MLICFAVGTLKLKLEECCLLVIFIIFSELPPNVNENAKSSKSGKGNGVVRGVSLVPRTVTVLGTLIRPLCSAHPCCIQMMS